MKDEIKNDDYSKQIFYVLFFLAFICFTAVLKVTASVTIPIAISILLALVLEPIVRTLNKAHIPWALATIIVSLLFLIVIILGGTILFTSMRTVLINYPTYEARFLTIYEFFADNFNLAFDAEKSFFSNLFTGLNGVFNFSDYVRQVAFSFSSGVYSFSRNLFIILLLMTFLLLEINIMSEKIKSAFEGKTKKQVTIIGGTIMREISRFIVIKFYISLATGILVYIGLKIIGLDFAIIWAVLSFILNFIPTFGSIISGGVTTVFATIQFFSMTNSEGNGKIIAVLLVMLLVNFVLGNIVEPKIEGDNLGVSPFVIVATLSLWGWIWGFVGMILSVPFIVILKIVCENVPYLTPIAILLSNKAK